MLLFFDQVFFFFNNRNEGTDIHLVHVNGRFYLDPERRLQLERDGRQRKMELQESLSTEESYSDTEDFLSPSLLY